MKKNLRYWFIVALSLVFFTPAMAGDDFGTNPDDTGSSSPSGGQLSDVLPDFPYAYYFEVLDPAQRTVQISGVSMPETMSMTGLVIPGELTKDDTTFYVRSIRSLSFQGQENITDLEIQDGTETIHSDALRYLTNLQYLKLPTTITEIGEGAFDNCDSLDNVYWNVPDYKATTNAYGPFYNVREHISNITFGEDVRAIPAYLCYGMTRLGNFESGSDSIRVVRAHAFEGCTSMYWFPFYEGLDTIETKAFMGCTGLSQGMSVMSSLQYVGDSAFANCTDLMSVDFNCEPDIFGRGVFAGCTSVESVTIPHSWNHIPDYLCENMTALKNFTQLQDYSGETISQTPITSIGQYAFAGCSSLETAPIWDSVGVIGFRAFKDCYSLTRLTIPAKVSTIGAEAFWDCSGLQSITSNAVTPPAANTAFTGVTPTIPVYVPSGSVSAYRQAAGWSGFYHIMTENSPNGVCGDNLMWMFSYEDSTLYITGSGAMYNYGSSDATGSDGSVGAMAPWFENDLNSQIYHVSLPTGLTSIGDYAFYSCSNLQSVDVPEWVLTIGDYAFQDCAQMSSCTLHYNLTSIGAYAFNQCMSLDSIDLPVTLASMGEAAFQSCEMLRFVEIPEGITSIPKNAFYACKNLNQVNLPTALLTIGEFAFNACSALPGITIPDKVTSIGDNAFEYCDNLTFIALPDSLQTIGGMAFYDCPLALVDLPAKLTNIGYGAFMNCSTITEVYCYATTPPTVEYAVGSTDQPVAFPDIASTTPVYVPVQSLLTYKYRTGWKTHNLIAMNLGGTCGDNLNWVLDFSDSTFTITGTGAMTDYQDDQRRPWVLYDDNDMPNDYSSIVKTLTLPEGMTTIGKNAFHFFSKITEVTIPSTVTSIGDNAFGACSELTSVTIPDNVTTLGTSAFSSDKKLTTIHIGSGLTTINTLAISSNPELATITVSGSNGTFDSRDSCNAIIKTATNDLVLGCQNTVIPNTVTSIASFAFSYCSKLTSITIPASVTVINGYAFSQCTGLTEITMESVTPPTYKSNAFNGVPDTIPVYVPAQAVQAYQTASGWTYFNNIQALPCDTVYSSEENLTIAESQLPYTWNQMELAEEGTFSVTLQTADGCDSIVTLHLTVLPGGSCGDNLIWMYNAQDSSLTISGTGAMTDYTAFSDAPWYGYQRTIFVLHLPEGLTTIGSYAFFDCKSLTSVTIPNSVTSIGGFAFHGCSGLTTLTIPNSVTSIGEYAFAYCSNLTTLTIGNSVTSIGDYAFYGCSGLTTLTIPNSVTSIEHSAFHSCTSLTSIEIPNSVTSIGLDAFSGCTDLMSMGVEDGNTIYDSRDNCNAIIETSTNTLIAGCQKTVIPNSVTSIGKLAFHNCTGMTSVTIPNSVISIGDNAFSECSGLTSIDIPNSVTRFGYNAFEKCTGLTSVTIPSSVTFIGGYAFSNCSILDTITCEAITPPTCGYDAFDNVPTSTCTLYVPYQSISDYQQAEQWKAFTNIRAIPCDTTYRSTEEVTIAETQLPYEWHDMLFTESLITYDSLVSIDGCDSIVMLDLTVLPVERITESDTICYAELPFEWRGQQLVVDGTYHDTVRTAVTGLDSIIYTMFFKTYLPVEPSTEEATICEGGIYEWHGMTLSEAGWYYDTLQNADGCDSICAIQLSVNPSYHFSETAVTCEGELFQWHGRYLETAGIYYDSLQTIYGCDSIYQLTLTVNPTYSVYDTAYICEGDVYEWNGETYSEEGQHMVNLYTVNGCDSFCYLQLYFYPTYYYEETEVLCEGQEFEWHGKSIKTSGEYYDSLQTVYGCDSIYKLVMTVKPTYFIPETYTICQGETYLWHGYEYTEEGIYYDSLTTMLSCDSIYELNLKVNPTYEFRDEATVCQGTEYLWHGQMYAEAGIYYDSLTAVNGCDSVWILTLTVNPTYTSVEEATICQGESYIWNDGVYTEAGQFTTTLIAQNYCDSVCTLNLTVNPTYAWSDQAVTCENEPFEWHGQLYTETGVYYDSLKTANGCDSIWTLTLTVYPTYNVTEEATICQHEYYFWHGKNYNTAGTYVDTLWSANGCDSVCTLNLTVNPTYEFFEEATVCQGTLYEWHGRYLENAGIYYDSLQTVYGCDSIYQLTLTVNPTYSVYDTAYICEGDVYEWNGETYSEEGQHMVNLYTVNGCDSFCYLQLYHYPTYYFEDTETVCEGEAFEWHGQSIKMSGEYYDSLQTVYGCDSIYKLVMTVKPTYFFPESYTICQGETYLWHGYEYTEAGIYYDSLTTMLSCDSVYELTLTVNPTYAFADEAVICEGTTYEWHGATYTEAGIYRDSLQTIHGCDSIWTLRLTVNPTYAVSEDASICEGESYFWNGETYRQAGQYTTTLPTINSCDSVCTLNLTVNPVYNYEDTAVICQGTTYEWHGMTYTEAGLYTDSLQTIHGCDSIWTLRLTVNPTYTVSEDASICEGDAYTWNGETYNEAGQYTTTLPTVNGCDSVCTLNLTVNPVYNYEDTAVICQGTTYEWHGMTYTEAGLYTDSLQTIHGCDSIWTLRLTVNPTYTVSEDAAICEGESFMWNGETYRQAGQYTTTLPTVNGCDSVCTLNLTVNPVYNYEDTAVICQGTTYEWHGATYTEAGIYRDSLQTIHGCDSIWTLRLTVNPTYTVSEDAAICEGDAYTWNGETYRQAGQYTTTLPTVNGCDSVCTLNLTVNPVYNYEDTAVICEGTTYEWHGMTYSEAGIYRDSLQTIHGCDSIWTLRLTVNPTYTVSEDAAICEGDAYTWNGETYRQAGQYTTTLPTVNGCDSVCTLNLTVNPVYHYEDTAVICQGTTYEWHGMTYTEAGIYRDSLQTIHGCDSIWTLRLTVNPTYTVSEDASICEGDAYTWNGETYRQAGQYTTTLPTINGCDSVCTLNLTVNPVYNYEDTAVICEGTTYEWHGTTYTEAGIYRDSLQTIHGCDSIWTLRLTVNPTYTVSEEAAICEGDAYTWNGETYRQAGQYTTTLPTINGCDSVCTLNLTVNPVYNYEDTAVICEGTTYEWHGATYTEAGIYRDSLQTIHGCDSIWTLRLTVNPTYTSTEQASLCQGESYSWNGQTYTKAGQYTVTIEAQNGCDSVCTLFLTVQSPVTTEPESASICEGDGYTWPGHEALGTLTQPGMYYDTAYYTTGCDSVYYTLTLTVDVPVNDPLEDLIVCSNDLPVIWQGMTLYAAGVYYDTVRNIHGCDSIYRTLTLTVNREAASEQNASICQGEQYTWHGHAYTQAGTYSDTLQTIHGCDSICTLNLAVYPTFTKSVEATICAGEQYIWNGKAYRNAGIYYDTLQSIHGCDSICTLLLMVQGPTTAPSVSASICEGDGYTWRGHEALGILTQPGTYYDTAYYTSGCDSVYYTLTLTVDVPVNDPLEDLIVCSNDLPVIWQGMTLYAAGVYYDTVRNIHGCDSVYRALTLIVNREAASKESATICEGETYSWHGRSLTKTGVYMDTLQTVHGCDSVCTLNLTVNPSYLIEEIVSIREDKLPYLWQGRTLTAAGEYTAEYVSVHGCDSIHTLQLMVTALPIYKVDVLADHGHVNGTGTYPEGKLITLYAVPDEGFEFQMWSDGTTTNPKDFTVLQDTTFRAHFYMPEVEQEVTIDSIETNSVTIIWDTVPGAVLYELRIYKNGELVVTYEIDPDNNIIGERFNGPDRLIARKDSTGGSTETLQVNVSGLESGQDYTYSLDALDDDRAYVGAQSGSFTTDDEFDALDETFTDKQRRQGARKLLINGHLFIELPDGTEYDARGALIE